MAKLSKFLFPSFFFVCSLKAYFFKKHSSFWKLFFLLLSSSTYPLFTQNLSSPDSLPLVSLEETSENTSEKSWHFLFSSSEDESISWENAEDLSSQDTWKYSTESKKSLKVRTQFFPASLSVEDPLRKTKPDPPSKTSKKKASSLQPPLPENYKSSSLPIQKSHIGPLKTRFEIPLDHPLIQFYLQKFQSPRERILMEKNFERALLFQKFILQKIDEYHLPQEFFFLPFIESEYNLGALSKAGALGLWQIMPNSISKDMRMEYWIDERKDFWKSTETALKKLRYNFEQLGDWSLALAAYNTGLARIKRILKENPGKGYWELADAGLIPKETKHYVPKFFALVLLINFHKRHEFSLPESQPIIWEKILVNKPLDIHIFAQKIDLPREITQIAYKELKESIIPPQKNYHLKLPAGFIERAKHIIDSDPFLLDEKSIIYYSIQAGDNLSKIAKKHHITLQDILTLNHFENQHKLVLNQKILLPKKSFFLSSKPSSSPAAHSQSISQNTSAPQELLYEVQERETLWGIAQKFKITVENLKEKNQLQNDLLIAHQKLIIPFPSSYRSYKVQEGDNLWKIAEKFQIAFQNIIELNRNFEYVPLKTGDIIYVPTS